MAVDLDKEVLSFARELGKTQEKLNAVDVRVKHNCEAAEKNFKSLDEKFTHLDDKFDKLNDTIITAMSKQEGRIAANEAHIAEQTRLTAELNTAVTKRSVALWFIFGLAILSFIFGRAYDWDWVKSFFHGTTVQERLDMVKDGFETGVEALGKLK